MPWSSCATWRRSSSRGRWPPGLYELVYNSCLRAGIDMERAWQSSQISSSLSMVNAGFGFALVPQSMTCIQQPNVSYHPLSGAPLKTDIAIAWRRFERSRTVKRFLAMF
ncbi:LysR substrate-binding domain-containing protein [Klebsiella pneumoniae]